MTGIPPIGEESRFQREYSRARDLEVGLPPLVGTAGVSLPLFGYSDTSGEGNLVIDDQDLAMGAMVCLPEFPAGDRPKALDGDPGTCHLIDEVGLHRRAAKSVENHTHANSSTRPFREEVGQLFGDLTGPIDKGDQVNGLLGFGYRVEHGGEDLVPIPENLYFISLREPASSNGFDRVSQAARRALVRTTVEMLETMSSFVS